MTLAHYALNDRVFMLMLSQYVALIIGGPLLFHQIIGYWIPARVWRGIICGMEARLNRLNRAPKDRKTRGSLVVWGVAGFLLFLGTAMVLITNHTPYGWYVEVLCVAYLIPLRAVMLPAINIQTAFRAKRFVAIPALLQPLTDKEVEKMDGHALIRETITYCARAFPRTIISPALWYLAGGLPLLLLCRFITMWCDLFPLTHPRTRAFATTGHFWNTLFQGISTRIALLFMWPALAFVPASSIAEARKTWLPAVAEPKLSFGNLPVRMAAYGLRISLGGPHDAGGIHRPDGWIGQGKAKLVSSDLTRALIWYGCCALLWLLTITSFYAY